MIFLGWPSKVYISHLSVPIAWVRYLHSTHTAWRLSSWWLYLLIHCVVASVKHFAYVNRQQNKNVFALKQYLLYHSKRIKPSVKLFSREPELQSLISLSGHILNPKLAETYAAVWGNSICVAQSGMSEVERLIRPHITRVRTQGCSPLSLLLKYLYALVRGSECWEEINFFPSTCRLNNVASISTVLFWTLFPHFTPTSVRIFLASCRFNRMLICPCFVQYLYRPTSDEGKNFYGITNNKRIFICTLIPCLIFLSMRWARHTARMWKWKSHFFYLKISM
jgi:hypothetical protein